MKPKPTKLERETDKPTNTVADFNTPLSAIHRSQRKKFSKDQELKIIINQLNLTDIQVTQANNSGIYILLKCTRNIPQNRPYLGS